MTGRPTPPDGAAGASSSRPAAARGEARLAGGILVTGLLVSAGVAWWFTLAYGGSSAMVASLLSTGSAAGWLVFLGIWSTMMVAMMFPAAAPMARAFVRLGAREGDRRFWLAGRTFAFLGTYAALWAAVGVTVALAYATLTPHLADLTTSGHLGPGFAGTILVAAGVYEISPVKDTCLRACRSPFSFLATSYRPGLRGAVRLGARHAAYCLGCCALLFAVLFAVGLMAVGWMALVALVIFGEKWVTGSPRSLFAGTVAVALVGLGVALVVAPVVVAPVLGLA